MKIIIERQIDRGQGRLLYDLTVKSPGHLLESQGVNGANRREVIRFIKRVLKNEEVKSRSEL